MRKVQIWDGHDGASGTSNGWFPLSNLLKPTLHVHGLHASDIVKVWVTAEDSPTVDSFTNAVQLGSDLAGVNGRFLPEEQQGFIAVELDTNGGSVATRQARLTSESQG